MRATQYISYMNRTDLALGKNPKDTDYTHLTITMLTKRARYTYQKQLKGQQPVK